MRIARVRTGWHGAQIVLAIVALAIQTILPDIVGAEIDLAGHGGASLFDHCLVGNIGHDSDEEQNGSADPEHHHHDGGCGLCPICLALLANPIFAAPAPLAVPVPVSAFVFRIDIPQGVAPTVVATAPYQSRAPPIG